MLCCLAACDDHNSVWLMHGWVEVRHTDDFMVCHCADRSPKDLLELAPGEQLRQQAADIEFAAALSALSILRWGAVSKPSMVMIAHAACAPPPWQSSYCRDLTACKVMALACHGSACNHQPSPMWASESKGCC